MYGRLAEDAATATAVLDVVAATSPVMELSHPLVPLREGGQCVGSLPTIPSI